VHLLGTADEDWWPCGCFAACARKHVLLCSIVPPTAVRPPHRPENEACCIWKNAAVKQPSVRSLPIKTKRFIATVKKSAAVLTARAL